MISVIIPVYNVADYLSRCLESIVVQITEHYEIIIIDDGSTDSSYEIAKRYQSAYPNYIRLYRQENLGLGGARNTGIKYSSGRYLLFIDSDDYIEPGMFLELENCIRNKQADIVLFDANVMDSTGRFIKKLCGCAESFEITDLKKTKSLLWTHPTAWNKLYRKSLLEDNKIEFPEHVWYEDIYVTYKLLPHANAIVYVQKPLYNYVQRDGSIMSQTCSIKNLEIIAATENVIAYYKKLKILDCYGNALKVMAIHHIFAVAIRVCKTTPNDPVIEKLLSYIYRYYPQFLKNPYYQRLPYIERMQIHLIYYKKNNIIFYLARARKKYVQKIQYFLDKMLFERTRKNE